MTTHEAVAIPIGWIVALSLVGGNDEASRLASTQRDAHALTPGPSGVTR